VEWTTICASVSLERPGTLRTVPGTKLWPWVGSHSSALVATPLTLVIETVAFSTSMQAWARNGTL